MDVQEGATARAIFDTLAKEFPALEAARSSTMLARNQEFAAADALLAEGDEVALLPPVSGGSDVEAAVTANDGIQGPWTHQIVAPDTGSFYALTRLPIDGGALARQLLQGHDGAFVNFEGVVRNNTKGRATKFLDYECYEAMAIKKMAEIGEAIAANPGISRIAMVHRLGRMEIGETSVLILAFAPHRKPAFEAALEGINRLKKLVPIWKKEHFVDGEVWVDGEWDEGLKPVGQ